MSERTGDKARFHRERRKKALRRVLNRVVVKPSTVKASE